MSTRCRAQLFGPPGNSSWSLSGGTRYNLAVWNPIPIFERLPSGCRREPVIPMALISEAGEQTGMNKN
jgi:hypothetical protein